MKLIAAWYAWFKVAMIRFLISSPSRVGRLPINLAVM
jgi:hypothetical protein